MFGDRTNYPGAIYGDNNKFCVDDWLFTDNSNQVSIALSYTVSALYAYIDALREIKETLIMSGKTHDAMTPLIELLVDVANKMGKVTSEYKCLCDHFLNDIDYADQYIYEKTASKSMIRDFSLDKEHSLQASVMQPSKHDFFLTKLVYNIMNEIGGGAAELRALIDESYKKSERYQAAIINLKGASKKDIADIFSEARRIDGEYGSKLGVLYDEYIKLLQVIEEVKMTFSAAEGITVQSVTEIKTKADLVAVPDFSRDLEEKNNKQLENIFRQVLRETVDMTATDFDEASKVGEIMKYIKGDWVDEELDGLPMWARENIKEGIKLGKKKILGGNLSVAYDITAEILDGNYEKAAKKGLGTLFKGTGPFGKLEGGFYASGIVGTIEGTYEFITDPSIENLGQIGWNMSAGAVLDSTSETAWDVVKRIPWISDFYEKNGVTSAGEAFNYAYTEWTRVFFGDEVAEGVKTYYADNGGLFKGLVHGGQELYSEFKESKKKHGGVIGMWVNGWNYMWGKG